MEPPLAPRTAAAVPGTARTLRVVTWNVYRCRGLDGRTRPQRIARVLQRIGADVVALQEVLSLEHGGGGAQDQAAFIAAALGLDVHHGTNRMIGRARYGNVVLTRLPAVVAEFALG